MKLFNPACLQAKTKVCKVMLWDFFFADDAALVTHSEEKLENLLDRFSNASEAFRLSISLKKMKVMWKGSEATLSLTINDYVYPGCCLTVYLPWLHHFSQCLSELGARKENWNQHVKAFCSSVGEQDTYYSD